MADLAKGKLGQGFHNFECIQSSTADINSVDCVSVFRLLLGAESRPFGRRLSQVTG